MSFLAKRGRKLFHGGRAMLNLPGHQSTAAMVAEIEDTGPANATQDRRDNAPTYTLQIANCDRSIAFEIDSFGWWDKDDEVNAAMKNDLHKLDTMIKLLTEFREGLATEQRRWVRRRPPR